MESGELTRKRAAAANLYAARQNPVDADIVTRNNRLKAAAQAFVAPYNQTKYINAPCCPPLRTAGAASDYGDSRLDEASFTGTAINTFTNVMDRRAGAAICCGPPPATALPQGVQLYGDCSCLTAPAGPSGLPPNAPVIDSILPDSESLTVLFTAPTDDGGSPILNYRYLIDGTLSGDIVSGSPFTITGLINGTSYTIELYAVNAIGNGPNSDPATGIAGSPPGPPTILTPIITGNTTLVVAFEPPFSDGGSDIQYYRYLVDGVLNPNIISVNDTQFTITGLTNGILYAVEMYAVNAVGPGPNSNEAKGTPATIPDRPIITTVAPLNGSLYVYFKEPFNGGSDILYYEYSLNGGPFLSNGAISSPVEIYGLTNEETYSVSIRAVNSVNYGPSSSAVSATPSEYMIINIEIDNPNSIMRLPFKGISVNVTVDWGDGTTLTYTGINPNIYHTYLAAGNYKIYISGQAYAFTGDNSDTPYTGVEFITSVEQWGSLGLIVLNSAFNYATKLTSVPSSLPPGIINTQYMFKDTPIFNQDISKWNVDNVTVMDFMFAGGLSFNQNLSDWNISKVIQMKYMFAAATSFNSPLNWGTKTHNLIEINNMFDGATSFNQDLSSWDVSNVEKMQFMFRSALVFNSPLNWGEKTSKITNMESMFANAINFNQDISGWNVSEVTNMDRMFYGAYKFNQDLSLWNVQKVTNMSRMFASDFYEPTIMDFNSPLTWGAKTAAVTDMSEMFANAQKFNQDISGWDVSNVITMNNMFNNAIAFNRDLSTWNVAKIENMVGMFYSASNFNSPLNWGTTTLSVTDMSFMFYGATAFNQDISGWYLTSGPSLYHMFENATNFNNGGQPLIWGAKISNVQNMNGMFYNAVNFNQDISSWNVGNVTDMTDMFNGAILFNQNLSSWNVSKVINMTNMFQNATAFNSPLNWGNKTALVQNMAGMFSSSAFNQDISGWDVSSVTNMTFMFFNNNAFNNGGQPLIWGNKTQNVIDMTFMFKGATNFNANITGWNVSSVQTMLEMFVNALLFDQDLSSWTATALTNASNMFCECPMLGQTAKYPPILLTLGQNYGC